MELSRVEIIGGKCYVGMNMLENEISKNKMLTDENTNLKQALNEIRVETLKWASSSTCVLDDFHFKEKILQIIDKVLKDNE